MREEDVSDLLRRRCKEAGGQRAFARAHGLLVQHVSQVVNRQRPPSKNLCKALGIRPDGMRWVKDDELWARSEGERS
jgi:hypothetical protein